MKKRKVKKRKLAPFKTTARALTLMTKLAPLEVALSAALTLLLAAQSGAFVYVNQFFYDAVIDAATGNGKISLALTGAAAFIGLLLTGQIGSVAGSLMDTHLYDKIKYGLFSVYDKKSASIPAQKFEDPDFLDQLEKANDGIFGTMGMLIVAYDILLYYGVYFVITGGYLWHIRPVLLLTLVLIFVPSIITTTFQMDIYASQADALAPLRRRAGSYYGAAVNLRETRLFGIFGYFQALIADVQKEIFARKWDTERKNARLSLCMNLCRALGWCGIVLLMITELVRGNITVGVFAAVYASMKEMFSNSELLLFRIKVDISQNLGMIKDYFDFLNLPTGAAEDTEPDFDKGICARNVCFSYPKAEQKAVNGASLTIAPGETVAIVGENGSGKTTLAKLLCGLYLPDSGSVLLGGADTARTSARTLFSQSTAVFQNYIRYDALSLKDNVKVSRADKSEEVGKALEAVNADFVSGLPEVYDTVLSRDYDGAELSGGQWQRVAMARGLYRPHEFIILDEPTAAIDPLEETRIYKMFAEYTRGKIGILITHRLGSARIADRILVMDRGRIIESGSHEELLAAKGRYAEMWEAAAEGFT